MEVCLKKEQLMKISYLIYAGFVAVAGAYLPAIIKGFIYSLLVMNGGI